MSCNIYLKDNVHSQEIHYLQLGYMINKCAFIHIIYQDKDTFIDFICYKYNLLFLYPELISLRVKKEKDLP